MNDCRTQTRYTLPPPLVKDATVTLENVIYRVNIINVSNGGIFVKLPFPPTVGNEMMLSFCLPGVHRRCHIPCSVRWAGKDNGAGLKFLHLEEKEKGELSRLIRMLQVVEI